MGRPTIFTCLLALSLVLHSGTSSTKIHSAVVDLNDRFIEFKDQGVWFVKFYAPWCGHCKQLAPIWEQVAHALEDAGSEVKMAKMDCTRFTAAAGQFDVRGYPTLKFFKRGQEFVYDGERTKEALIDFALKSSGPTVREVSSLPDWNKAIEFHRKKPYFVYIHGNQSNVQLRDEYSEVADTLMTKSYFYETSLSLRPVVIPKYKDNPDALVVCFKDERFFVYDPTKEGASLADWVNNERWALYPRVGYGNLRDIGTCCNRLLVLAVVDSGKTGAAKTDIAKFNTLISRVAQHYTHSQDLQGRFQFGWLDGGELASSIVLGEMKPPSLMVYNYELNEFYLPDDDIMRMTDHSLVVWLQQIMNGQRQALGGRGYLMRFKRMAYEIITTFYDFRTLLKEGEKSYWGNGLRPSLRDNRRNMFATQPLLTCCLFGLPAGIFAIICYSMCSADFSVEHEEIYPDSEDDPSEDESDHEKRD